MFYYIYTYIHIYIHLYIINLYIVVVNIIVVKLSLRRPERSFLRSSGSSSLRTPPGAPRQQTQRRTSDARDVRHKEDLRGARKEELSGASSQI